MKLLCKLFNGMGSKMIGEVDEEIEKRRKDESSFEFRREVWKRDGKVYSHHNKRPLSLLVLHLSLRPKLHKDLLKLY